MGLYVNERGNQSYTALQSLENEINSILEKSNSKRHTTIYKRVKGHWGRNKK